MLIYLAFNLQSNIFIAHTAIDIMPGRKGCPQVAMAANYLIKRPNLTTAEAMELAGFSFNYCQCRRWRKRVNQKKIRLLKAKGLPLLPKERRCYRPKEKELEKNIKLYYGTSFPLIFDSMLLYPSGSPRIALAATYLIINPYLSIEQGMRSAQFSFEDYRCRTKQNNVSQKKIRLIRAFSKTLLHIPELSFKNPIDSREKPVRKNMMHCDVIFHFLELVFLNEAI